MPKANNAGQFASTGAPTSGALAFHYPALDGLRGVAVLLVLLFHGFLGMPIDTGYGRLLTALPMVGWLGVDLFFVLSGFLITGILLDSKSSPHRYRNFYARRALRIFPVYYLLLAVIFIALPSFVAFETEGLRNIIRNQGWLWTHLTNVGFIVKQKAWATSDWLNLNHLWSLAVEEQFYLAWPLVVFSLSSRNLKRICLSCIIAACLLRGCLWLTHQRNGALYFPTPCRIDGLCLGSMLALLVRERTAPAALSEMARRLAIAGGLGLLVVAILRGGIRFDDSPTVVFGVASFNLLAGGLLVACLDPTLFPTFHRLMKARSLAAAGKYSYSIYLFHGVLRDPLSYVFTPKALNDALGSKFIASATFTLLYSLASLGAAIISWHLVERHFLRLRRHFRHSAPPDSPMLVSNLPLESAEP